MDLLDIKRQAVCNVPAVECDIEKPLFAGDFTIFMPHWSDQNDDYEMEITNAYFDGKDFHLYDITLYDKSNWITNWCYFATGILKPGTDSWLKEVNKGRYYPNPKYCKLNPETKKYELGEDIIRLQQIYKNIDNFKKNYKLKEA